MQKYGFSPKPEPLSFEGNVANIQKILSLHLTFSLKSTYGNKDNKAKAFILLNLARKEEIQKNSKCCSIEENKIMELCNPKTS